MESFFKHIQVWDVDSRIQLQVFSPFNIEKASNLYLII